MPESPDIDHLIRAELIEQLRLSAPGMTEAQRHLAADEMLAFAKQEGQRHRREYQQEQVERLRSTVTDQARRGVYRRHLWKKLRRLESRRG